MKLSQKQESRDYDWGKAAEGVETAISKASLGVAFCSFPHRQAAFRVKLKRVFERMACNYLRCQNLIIMIGGKVLKRC